MRRLFISIAAALSVLAPSFAQEDTQQAAAAAAAAIAGAPEQQAEAAKPKYWTPSLGFDIGISQTYLEKWAAGGYNTVTLKAALDAKANYKKDLTSWTNRLQLDYGFLYSADKPLIQKSSDRIYFESKLALKTSEKSKWNYAASLDFRSQFAKGWNYGVPSSGSSASKQEWLDAATLKSDFLAPGYLNLALGIDWKPSNSFNVNIAPLTGGVTFCRESLLRTTYGMEIKPEFEDAPTKDGSMYRSARFQFGAQLKADYKATINDVFKFETQLVLFSDYLNNPQNLRVNWDTSFEWTLSKLMKVGLKTWLIYDPIVLIEGRQLVQFKENLSFSFTYTLAPKKK